MTDTVYRMNDEHLSHDVETVFESLDDADVRTAGTTYLIYRGRHEHEVANESALARIVTSTLFRRTIEGPQELFYADLYASRRTGCRGQLGLPGARDQHTGCVGSYLAEHDLFDFLLFSLPDNDAYSHRNGPHAQVTSLAAADRQIERLMHAAGGPDEFLAQHAVIVCSDHSQAPVEERIRLDLAFADFDVATPSPSRSIGGRGRAQPRPALGDDLRARRGPPRQRHAPARATPSPSSRASTCHVRRPTDGEAVVRSRRGELRFAAGGELTDARGERWSVEGDLGVLRAELQDGRFLSTEYPDALARVWSALHCPNAGDVLLSAAPGYEFVDWGGSDHVGGGSHGSPAPLRLARRAAVVRHRSRLPRRRDQWSLRDIAPMVRRTFRSAIRSVGRISAAMRTPSSYGDANKRPIHCTRCPKS